MSPHDEVLSLIRGAAQRDIFALDRIAEKLPNDARLQSLLAKGVDAFGDAERFGRWLRARSVILGRPPLQCLAEGAIEAVEDELTRIDHGDFA
jgi:uncharacterized protein (DUF2384 family)